MLNSYGRNVKPNIFDSKTVDVFIVTISNARASILGAQGIIICGSGIEYSIDYYTDINIKIFFGAENADAIKHEVYNSYEKFGSYKR